MSRRREEPPEGTRAVAGLVGGALLGYALGGPPGAFIGLLVGLFLGASSEEEAKKKR